MTRETKIGLLVGLAFIIVIGILLSDHLSSTTEPPPAQLAQAGASVRQGVNIPGASSSVPPITVVAPAPIPQVPQQPVPTQEELTSRPKPVVQIGIGPASNGTATNAQPPVTFVQPGPTDPATPVQHPTDIANTSDAPPTAPPTTADPLTEIANRAGEPIVGVDGNSIPTQSGLANNNGAQPTQLSNGFREYKAGEGDTVSRMATRFLGENTPANRDLIVKSNPSLQKNPDIVVAGRTYRIPMTAPAQSAVVTATKAVHIGAPAVASAEHTYTVKPGDSLWKIASNECGGASAISALKELNSDVLKGSDTVQVGMKLKLPGKAVASAN